MGRGSLVAELFESEEAAGELAPAQHVGLAPLVGLAVRLVKGVLVVGAQQRLLHILHHHSPPQLRQRHPALHVLPAHHRQRRVDAQPLRHLLYAGQVEVHAAWRQHVAVEEVDVAVFVGGHLAVHGRGGAVPTHLPGAEEVDHAVVVLLLHVDGHLLHLLDHLSVLEADVLFVARQLRPGPGWHLFERLLSLSHLQTKLNPLLCCVEVVEVPPREHCLPPHPPHLLARVQCLVLVDVLLQNEQRV
mmetsp:Transcript_5129/g.19020  ORF Transcript_5129/g.19020 Transcript_5129/m.19020 type:complete len:245 (+) Transcript_5129:72-806(+)